MRSLYKELEKYYKRIYDKPKELQTTVDRSITMYYCTFSQTKYPAIKPVTSVSHVNDSDQDPVTADGGDASIRQL
jgi:hypothetical protein